jgi:hypothetical protein
MGIREFLPLPANSIDCSVSVFRFLRPSQLVKLKFIQQEASKDNVNFNLDTYRSVGKDGRDGRDGLV